MQTDIFGLWPHQSEAVDKIESLWLWGTQGVCLQLPTGAGKSRIIRTIVDNHAQGKKVIYIIVHRSSLIKQLSNELKEAGVQHGIIQSGYPYVRYRVQVCSIQTLINRMDKIPEPEIIVIDEAHHTKSNSYQKIIDKWHSAKILGVTATPQRTDGKPLSDIFQELIIGPPMRELIDDGYLCDYDYFAPADIDMSGVHKRAGEYNQNETLERVDKKKIIGSAVEHYREYADHQPAIASCVSIAHAEHVADQFVEAGYKARAVHSKMDKKYIDESIEGLRTGAVEILCQCELLGEGVDIKGAVVLIGLRPTASIVVFLQHVGRVLRSMPGKKGAIILDHVGNWERHGLPDTERQWSLNGKIKAAEESTLKRCPQCMRPVAKNERKCPYCGFLWAATENPVERIPEEQEGKLVSIKGIDRKDKNQVVLDIARKAASLKQAVAVAKQHGIDHRGAWYIWTHELRNEVKS